MPIPFRGLSGSGLRRLTRLFSKRLFVPHAFAFSPERCDIDTPFEPLERVARRAGGYAVDEREQIAVAALRQRGGCAANADLHQAVHRVPATRTVDILEMHGDMR